MAFRFRRGTDLERQSITPRLGEPLYVTDTGKLYIGDGTTQGGTLLTAGVSDDPNPSLGGDLDLAGNDIVGSGNIDIDGYINATGNINLGDGVEDNIVVGGVIASSLIPDKDDAYDLGTTLSAWRTGYFNGLEVDTSIQAENLIVNKIVTQDSTELYNSDTGLLSARDIEANTIEADLTGSVFGDDSSLIIDAIDNKINALSINSESINSDSGNLDIGAIESPISLRLNLVDNLAISQTIEGDNPPYGFISTELSRGTRESPEAVQPGDEIGGIVVNAYTDSETRANGGVIAFFVADDANIDGSDFIKTNVAITASKDTEQDIEDAFILDSDGVAESNAFNAKKYMQLPVLADDTERSNKIDSPSKGMMIFIESGTNPSASNQMQIYDGTDWVNAS